MVSVSPMNYSSPLKFLEKAAGCPPPPATTLQTQELISANERGPSLSHPLGTLALASPSQACRGPQGDPAGSAPSPASSDSAACASGTVTQLSSLLGSNCLMLGTEIRSWS